MKLYVASNDSWYEEATDLKWANIYESGIFKLFNSEEEALLAVYDICGQRPAKIAVPFIKEKG